MSTLAIVGGSIAAYGILRQGMAKKAAAEYNARVMGEGIKETDIKASIIADKIRREKRQIRGIQMARYMRAGVILEGTPLEVLADTAAQYEEDIAINDYNRRLAIARLRMGIEAERIAGKEAMTAAVLGAGVMGMGAAASSQGPAPTQTNYGYWGSSYGGR